MSREQDVQATLAKARRYRDSVEHKLDIWRNTKVLGKRSHAFLDSITTSPLVDGILPLSSFPTSVHSTAAMIKALFAHHDEHKDRPHHQYWLGTLCLDIGICPLGEININLARIRRKTDKIMERHNLEGIHKIEPVFILPIDPADPIEVSFHTHMVLWRAGRKILPRKLAREIMNSPTVTNRYGLPITFRRCAMTDEHIAGLAYYLTKYPAGVEVLERNYGHGDAIRAVKDMRRLTPELAAKLVEILSHIDIYFSVRGVREGAAVRKRWKQELVRATRRSHNAISLRACASSYDWYRVHTECNTSNWRWVSIQT